MVGAVTAAMVATAIAPVAGAEVNPNSEFAFSDVSADYTHYENIYKAYEAKFMSGYQDGTFKPLQDLTRGNVVKALGKYVVATSGKELSEFDVSNVTPFSDVPATTTDKELYNYSLIVKQAGIFSGSNNKLMPAQDITRQQMAKVLVNAFDLKDLPGDQSKVTDNDKAFAEFVPYINILSENGVTDVSNFRPTETTVRGQFASFLVRAHEASKAAVTPQVSSVTALNAKEVEIKFSTKMDYDSLFTNVETGAVNNEVVMIDAVGDALDVAYTGELSEDGKTLLLTAVSGDIFDGRYSVTVTDAEDVNGTVVKDFAGFFTADDIVRPTVTGVTYTNASTAKISFSEPISDFGDITLNGKYVSVDEAGADYVLVDLSSLDNSETGTVTIVGAIDYVNNYISPNPVSVKVTRPAADVTAPTVSSMSVVSDELVKVVFSEELGANPTFTINGTNVLSTDIELQDDKVTYHVSAALLDGVNKVDVSNIVDTANNAGKAVSRQFIVTVDEVAPVLNSSKVLVDANGAEYLQLSFSEKVQVDVTTPYTFKGTLVADYVTDEEAEFTATPVVDKNDATKVNIPLQDAAKGTWTVDLPAGFVTDLAQKENAFKADDTTFVRGVDKVSTKPAELTVVAKETDNVVTLTFDGKVNGATAVDESNYTVEGAKVKSAVLTSNTDTASVVELTFEEGSIKADGYYELVIDGVRAADNTLVDAAPIDLDLTENVAPTLTSAVLVNGTDIELTFDDVLNNDTFTDEDDFTFKVGGVAYTGSYTVAETENTDELTLSLTTPLTSAQLAQTLTIESADALDLTDVSGNDLVDFGSKVVTKNIQ